MARWRANNPEKVGIANAKRWSNPTELKRNREYLKAYRKKNGDRIRARDRQYRADNPEIIQEIDRKKAISRKIKRQEKLQQLLTEQGGKCGCCGGTKGRWVRDHSHITKKWRKVLCNTCNVKLGFIEDYLASPGMWDQYLRENQ